MMQIQFIKTFAGGMIYAIGEVYSFEDEKANIFIKHGFAKPLEVMERQREILEKPKRKKRRK